MEWKILLLLVVLLLLLLCCCCHYYYFYYFMDVRGTKKDLGLNFGFAIYWLRDLGKFTFQLRTVIVANIVAPTMCQTH